MESGHNGHSLQDQRGCSKWLQEFSASVHRGISQYFGWHGVFVSRRPWAVIVLCLVLSVTTTSLYYGIMERELDSRRLFTPNTAPSLKDKDVYESFYGIPPSQTRILITRKVNLETERNCANRALLAKTEEARSYLLEIFSLFSRIESLRIEYKNVSYSLNDLCLRTWDGGPCSVMSVTDPWNHSVDALLADPDPIGTLTGRYQDPHGRSVNASFLLGVNDDAGDCSGNVEALQNWIMLHEKPERIDGARYDPRNRKWNLRLVQLLLHEWHSDTLTAFVSDLDAVGVESQRTLKKDTKLLWFSYLAVLVYCHIALFKNSRIQCKSHLAIVSCLSVIMAIYSAYGTAQLFGVKFNPVHRVLPFLLMGLGVDDTFVIMSAYHGTDVSTSVEDRIRISSIRAGSSILVTSVTDFAAFLAGTFTTLMGLRAFSIYAAIGVLFDFFYQITFFLAFLALDARRERRQFENYQGNEDTSLNGHADRMCHLRHASSRDLYTNGDQDKTDDSLTEEDGVLTIPFLAHVHHFPERKLVGSGNYIPRISFASTLVGQWMPRITLVPIGKVAVLLVEVVLLAFSIYGCANVKMDFRYEEWFVPDGSYLHDAMQIEKDYFLGNQYPFHAFTDSSGQFRSHFFAQDELIGFAQSLREDPHIATKPPIHSWYEDFIRYAEAVEPPSVLRNSSFLHHDDFISSLHRFLNSSGRSYSRDVIFHENGDEILSTRVAAFTTGIGSSRSALRIVDSIRETVKNAAPSLHAIAYSYGFIYYDGYRVIAWETTRNVMVAGVAVFLVTLAILANFLASVCVLLMVALTDVMLFGLMWYLGLTFNGVTCICMVLAVGIAVDYSVHIAHSFLVVTGSRQQRAEQALRQIGGAVLNGAFTTGLSVVVLSLGKHYIFQTFFRIFLAIVVCGLWHGLIILPVVLSLIGPDPYPMHDQTMT